MPVVTASSASSRRRIVPRSTSRRSRRRRSRRVAALCAASHAACVVVSRIRGEATRATQRPPSARSQPASPGRRSASTRRRRRRAISRSAQPAVADVLARRRVAIRVRRADEAQQPGVLVERQHRHDAPAPAHDVDDRLAAAVVLPPQRGPLRRRVDVGVAREPLPVRLRVAPLHLLEPIRPARARDGDRPRPDPHRVAAFHHPPAASRDPRSPHPPGASCPARSCPRAVPLDAGRLPWRHHAKCVLR